MKKKKLLRTITRSPPLDHFFSCSRSVSPVSITLSPARDHSFSGSRSLLLSQYLPLSFSVSSSLLLRIFLYPSLFLPPSLSLFTLSLPLCVFHSSLLRCRSVYKLASRASLDSQPAIRFTIVAFCFSFASLEDFLFSQSRLRSSAIVSCTFDRKHFLCEITISIFVKKNV